MHRKRSLLSAQEMEKAADKRYLSPSRAGHVPPAKRLLRTASAKAPDYTGEAVAFGRAAARGKSKSRVFARYGARALASSLLSDALPMCFCMSALPLQNKAQPPQVTGVTLC